MYLSVILSLRLFLTRASWRNITQFTAWLSFLPADLSFYSPLSLIFLSVKTKHYSFASLYEYVTTIKFHCSHHAHKTTLGTLPSSICAQQPMISKIQIQNKLRPVLEVVSTETPPSCFMLRFHWLI